MKAIATFFISFIFIGTQGISTAQESGRPYSFQFDHLPLRFAVDSLMRHYPESIVYFDKDVENKFITADCVNCGFEQALDNVLFGTDLIWMRIGNQVVLKEQELPDNRKEGTISGTATDSLT